MFSKLIGHELTEENFIFFPIISYFGIYDDDDMNSTINQLENYKTIARKKKLSLVFF